MSDEMPEEDWELETAKFFPQCPFCGSKSLEFDIKYGRKYDYIDCHDCQSKWEIEWKGEEYEIETVKLVEVRDVEKIMLKGKKHRPQFWLRMALGAKEISPTEKPPTEKVEKTTTKKDHKATFLIIGFIFAWLALYLMLADFYEGLVEVTVSVVQGGTYHPYYLQGERMGVWLVCVAVSSICLAIGLRVEER